MSERKKPIDALIESQVKWEVLPTQGRNDDKVPYATHAGVLELGGVKLTVFRLSNGMNVIDEQSFHAFLSMLSGEQPFIAGARAQGK